MIADLLSLDLSMQIGKCQCMIQTYYTLSIAFEYLNLRNCKRYQSVVTALQAVPERRNCLIYKRHQGSATALQAAPRLRDYLTSGTSAPQLPNKRYQSAATA